MGGILFSILLATAGALAVYPRIVQARPDFKQLLDKILPYQGLIGLVVLVGGFLWGLRLLGRMGMMMTYVPVLLVLDIVSCVDGVLLGLLLGYGLIAQYILGNNIDALRHGENWRSRLAARQTLLGWTGLGLGIVGFLMRLVM
jgi:hypothetical protein